MTTSINIDKNCCTTKLLTNENPVINNTHSDKYETCLFLPIGKNRQAEGGLRSKGYFKKSYPNKPLVSIVTTVYNGEEFIEQTMKSVFDQDYDNIEYIVIDANSSDGTVDIIKRYEDKIDYWISEDDRGISHGYNKGIMCSTGEIIGIINASDWYEEGAVKHVIENMTEDMLGGKMQYWDNGIKEDIGDSNFDNLERDMTVQHPTVFIKKSVYKKYGLFDEYIHGNSDYELLLRFYVNGASHQNTDFLLSNMVIGGFASQNSLNCFKQAKDFQIKYGVNPIKCQLNYYKKYTFNSMLTLLYKLNLKPFIKWNKKHFKRFLK